MRIKSHSLLNTDEKIAFAWGLTLGERLRLFFNPNFYIVVSKDASSYAVIKNGKMADIVREVGVYK